jgi:hypothetical protein
MQFSPGARVLPVSVIVQNSQIDDNVDGFLTSARLATSLAPPIPRDR